MILAVLTALSVFALLVGIVWRESILAPGGNLNLFWFAVFIIAPLAVLVAEAHQLSRRSLQRTSLSARFQSALVLVMTFAPLFSVGILYLGITDTAIDWLYPSSIPAPEPLPPPVPRYMKYVMILVYAVIPFVLSFLGGYLAVREQECSPDKRDRQSRCSANRAHDDVAEEFLCTFRLGSRDFSGCTDEGTDSQNENHGRNHSGSS
jgi:hypothetical protein